MTDDVKADLYEHGPIHYRKGGIARHTRRHLHGGGRDVTTEAKIDALLKENDKARLENAYLRGYVAALEGKPPEPMRD